MKSGRYDSTDDMINAALATLQMHDELSSEEIADLRAEVDKGIAEADRGEFVDITEDEIIAQCRAEFQQKSKGS
jgi:Arc/MetJ-type ribon-helix-helix transcriptional regulator